MRPTCPPFPHRSFPKILNPTCLSIPNPNLSSTLTLPHLPPISLCKCALGFSLYATATKFFFYSSSQALEQCKLIEWMLGFVWFFFLRVVHNLWPLARRHLVWVSCPLFLGHQVHLGWLESARWISRPVFSLFGSESIVYATNSKLSLTSSSHLKQACWNLLYFLHRVSFHRRDTFVGLLKFDVY